MFLVTENSEKKNQAIFFHKLIYIQMKLIIRLIQKTFVIHNDLIFTLLKMKFNKHQ